MSGGEPGLRLAPQGGGTGLRWQREGSHDNVREPLMKEISRLLQRKHGLASWGLHPAHRNAIHLEEILFRTASCKEEYANLSTLEARLQQVAIPQLQQKQQMVKMESGRAAQQVPKVEATMDTLYMGGGNKSSTTLKPCDMLPQANGGATSFGGMRMVPGGIGGPMMGQGNHRLGYDMTHSSMVGNSPVTGYNQSRCGMQLGGTHYGNHSKGGGPLMSNGMPIVLDRGMSRDWSLYPDACASSHRGYMMMSGMVPVNMRQNPGGFPTPETPPRDVQTPQMFPGQVTGSFEFGAQPPRGPSMDRSFDGQQISPMMQVPTSITVPPNRTHIPVTSLPTPSTPATPQTTPAVPGGGDAPTRSGMAPFLPGMRLSKQGLRECQHILIMVRHCGKCREGDKCSWGEKCAHVKKLLPHVFECQDENCRTPFCSVLRPMLHHLAHCNDSKCSFCRPINDYARKEREIESQNRHRRNNGLAPGPPNMPIIPNGMNGVGGMLQDPMQNLMSGSALPGLNLTGQKMNMVPSIPVMCPTRPSLKRQFDSSVGPGMVPVTHRDSLPGQLQGMVPVSQIQPQMVPVQDPRPCPKRRKHVSGLSSNPSMPMMPQRLMGTSLLETFQPDEIREHVNSLRSPSWTKPNDVQKEENCCICGDGDLNFEPPVITCESCFAQVRRAGVYWELPQKVMGTRCLFCHSCVTRETKDQISLGSKKIRRSDLLRRKNDEVEAEAWVQCDLCGFWAHQLCAMFNKGQNADGMSYNCPDCLIEGLKSGRRQVPTELPRAMWPALKLPECSLSQALEARVQAKLVEERELRARKLRMRAKDVPTAEGLTIRVVNIAERSTVVQPNFLKAFKKRGFPEEFCHKQKVIFLFQKINGVDVCLFAVYTQEYGDNCPMPNRKWVYLSYVDSVKYFQPEVQSVTGHALRTYVYHELLLGYFKYAKEMGFCAVFIWACPPSQTGDDYILYCKPQRQKTPTPDRLRNWYMEMIQKGQLEGIITRLSNLSDVFFHGGRDQGPGSFSAMDVPYFDGDYWPGEVEKLLSSVLEEAVDDCDKKVARSGGKRKSRGRGATTDELLLNSILKGQPVPQWEDFMVVHLREPCSFCRRHIEDGFKYIYKKRNMAGGKIEARERRFEGIRLDGPLSQQSLEHLQLCGDCYKSSNDSSLPAGIDMSDFKKESIGNIPPVKDPDGDISCEILESRHSFLSLCKGNHYQFDTLRRAKHSTMMVLYHLHNPMAPAFASTCNSCQREMEPGCGFRCSVCTDFDMCQECRDAGVHHEHPLLPQGKEMGRKPMSIQESFQQWLKALEHAAVCSGEGCSRKACSKMKQLIQHSQICQITAAGQPCQRCNTYKALLRKHSRQCTTEHCRVFQCAELKDRFRRSKRNEHGMRVRHYMMGYGRGPQIQQMA